MCLTTCTSRHGMSLGNAFKRCKEELRKEKGAVSNSVATIVLIMINSCLNYPVSEPANVPTYIQLSKVLYAGKITTTPVGLRIAVCIVVFGSYCIYHTVQRSHFAVNTIGIQQEVTFSNSLLKKLNLTTSEIHLEF